MSDDIPATGELPRDVRTAQLAALIDLGQRQIHKLGTDGVVVRSETNPKHYDLRRSVVGYIANLRQRGRGASGKAGQNQVESYDKERARLTSLKADAQDMTNRALTGELLERTAVLRELGIVFGSVKSQLRAVPAMARIQAGLDAKQSATVLELIDKALDELASGEYGDTESGTESESGDAGTDTSAGDGAVDSGDAPASAAAPNQ